MSSETYILTQKKWFIICSTYLPPGVELVQWTYLIIKVGLFAGAFVVLFIAVILSAVFQGGHNVYEDTETQTADEAKRKWVNAN